MNIEIAITLCLQSVRGVALMNEKQILLIRGVMDSINGTLEMYEKDATHAPADWLLENWWYTLEAAISFRDKESL